MGKEKIIILGGSSGIGEATANLIHSRYPDKDIIVVDKNKCYLKFEYEFYKLDLNNENEVLKFNNYIQNLKIKTLVNSVGYQENIDILDIKAKNIKDMLQVTLNSIILIEQTVAKTMIKNKTRNASIINVTSIHSHIIREIAHYSSSKAALNMFTKELAYRLSSYNIRVNSVLPGSINTPLLRKDLFNNELLAESAKQIPLKRHGEANEIAEVIEFLISDRASYITGSEIVVDGGLSLVI